MELQRVTASAILFLLTALFAWGQYAPLNWDSTGVPVRQGHHIDWFRAGVEDEGGNVIYAWADARTGDRNVYAQKVSPGGDKLWDDEGVTVIGAAGHQKDPCLISTGFGDYIVIWSDFRDDSLHGDIYAQKLDAGGNILWDSLGILLSTGDMTEPRATLRLIADGTGGAIAAWVDLRNGNEDVYAIRIQANGTIPPEWPDDGLVVIAAPASQWRITADSDGRGGAIIAWVDNQTVVQGWDIYMQRITIEGELAWAPSTGVPVCQADYDQYYHQLCQDGSGGAYIVWWDQRDDFQGDLYFHHVSDSGTMVFPEPDGKPLIVYDQRQDNPRIVADGGGNAIIVWEDQRDDPLFLTSDIYAQKVNSVGDKLWDPDGNAVCTDTTDQREVRLSADGTGSAICTWMDERNGNPAPYSNIYAQRIDGDGSMAWEADGVPVCEASGYQYNPLVRAFPDYSLIAWNDRRSGSPGVWYQKLDAAGAPQLTLDGDTLMWGISGNADNVKLVKGGDGKTFVFFQDEREWLAGPTAYVQIIDTTGNVHLEANGRPICPDPLYTDNKDQKWIDACRDGAGGAIAVWEDERDSNPGGSQIYAQRLDLNGELLWGSSGLQVSPYIEDQWKPRIVSDENGGALVVWDEWGGSYPYYEKRVRAARINPAGSVLWTVTVADTVADDILQDIAPDGSGGVYICYRSDFWPDYNLYGQHVDASGSLLWGEYRFPICTAEEKQINGRVVSLGPDGAIFVWEDRRNYEETRQDLYAQRISYEGWAYWEVNGIAVNESANDQDEIDLSFDEQGYLYVTWVDWRNSVTDIYLQKIDLDGQLLYPDSGLAVCTANGEQYYPRILSDGSGGNYLVWLDYRTSCYYDLYGTHLDAEGQLSTATVPGWPEPWVQDGNIICDAPRRQSHPQITDDDSYGVIVVWEDGRSSPPYEQVTNLYAQRLKGYLVGVDPSQSPRAAPTAFRLHPAFPNPFNSSARIRFDLPVASWVMLEVFDIQGRRVWAHSRAPLQMNPGQHDIVFDGSDLASGIYIYRLEAGDFTSVRKMVLMK